MKYFHYERLGILKLLSVSLLLFVFSANLRIYANRSFVWYDGLHAVSYSVSDKVSPVVKIAVDMLSNDIQTVTGRKARRTGENESVLRIVQLDNDGNRGLASLGIPLKKLECTKEAFCVKVVGHHIMIIGSDANGTAYGVLQMSRLAGVSPWIWWNDVIPEHKDILTVDSRYEMYQSPSVSYRGIFINDEDWSLRPWSYKTYEPNMEGVIGPKTYRQIFSLLLRLRANSLWPAMHPGTKSFFSIKGNKEMSDSFNISIGSSHCEPLLRNNVDEWDVKKRGDYNYMTNKRAVLEYWSERLMGLSGDHKDLFTIGMRGIHDGEMEGVKTLYEKTEALQNVIDDQRVLLSKYINKNLRNINQVFLPYKEVLEIYDNGLKVPDDVTLMWCDDNYGYLTRLSDSLQQKRTGGSGIYYHLSYWGRPHDYLWLTTLQPGILYNEMKTAYDCHARKVWIVNVHDPKIANYDLELFMDLAWNINSVDGSSLETHLQNWLAEQYGKKIALELLPAIKNYFRLCEIRRPEFMGWSRTEESERKYKRGLTPVTDSDMDESEMNTYLSDYATIANKVKAIENKVPERLRDAYFIQIKYPVCAAASMAEKWLYAQKYRHSGNVDYKRKSIAAYDNIVKMTTYYNEQLCGGKWKYSIDYHPRNLPVFDQPVLNSFQAKDRANIVNKYIVRNAVEYNQSSIRLKSIQMLGHSMHAVPLPKGESITYHFDMHHGGDAVLLVAMIPTQPNDQGDLRYSVSIDNMTPIVFSMKEAYRSETWKNNVMCGQSIKKLHINILSGHHKLTIRALDNHVILDQWMLIFEMDKA
jgi:hypothetical protein